MFILYIILTNFYEYRYFGEMSLLTREKRSASVRANSRVEVPEVSKYAMEQAFKKFPDRYAI